jgi:F0F1-type ATP synthase assembly protein I
LPSTNYKKDLLRYAGLGSQLLAGIGIAVFIGLKADQWLHTSPLFASVLPLLTLTGMFYKLARETSRKKNLDNQQKRDSQ